ncbi:MAG: hypothetical protein EHM35_20330, partial [Planctomycetaceae bacterium]
MWRLWLGLDLPADRRKRAILAHGMYFALQGFRWSTDYRLDRRWCKDQAISLVGCCILSVGSVACLPTGLGQSDHGPTPGHRIQKSLMTMDGLAHLPTGAEDRRSGSLDLLRGWPSGLLMRVALISALFLAAASAFQAYSHLVFDIALYLPLHSILELASVVVSFSIFALYVNAHRDARDARGVFIGTGFLAVAILDTFHTLGFLGMPLFITPSSTEKAIYYWLTARMWASIVLLGALLLPPGTGAAVFRMRWLLLVNLGLPAIAFAAVSYFPSHLPRMFVVGQGLTLLKTGLEIGVATLALAGVILYARAAQKSGDRFYAELAVGLVLTVFSEFCMAFYTVAYDSINLLGHLFKIGAYYFIFRGLFVAAVRKPYVALEQLKEEADDRLARTIERLAETTRAERLARERAEAAIEMLRPLQTVEEAFHANRNLDDLLHGLLERVNKALGADCATVFLLASDGRTLRIRASVGLDKGAREVTSIPIGSGIAGAIASKGEP